MAVQVARHRLTVDEVLELNEQGAFGPDDRLELIDGVLQEMSPIGDWHARTVDWLNDTLAQALGRKVLIRVQGPVRATERDLPQPDIMLLRRRDDYYAGGHPRPDDVFLVVEVSDTTVARDRFVKLPRYALAGLQDVWVADLPADCLWVNRQPAPDGFQDVRQLRRGDRVAPLAFPDLELSVDDILGPALRRPRRQRRR